MNLHGELSPPSSFFLLPIGNYRPAVESPMLVLLPLKMEGEMRRWTEGCFYPPNIDLNHHSPFDSFPFFSSPFSLKQFTNRCSLFCLFLCVEKNAFPSISLSLSPVPFLDHPPSPLTEPYPTPWLFDKVQVFFEKSPAASTTC